MSFTFVGFVAKVADMNNKISFVGKETRLPILLDGTSINEYVAMTRVGDIESKSTAYAAKFFCTNDTIITNQIIVKLQASLEKARVAHNTLSSTLLKKALSFTTRTCGCCKRATYMQDYANALQRNSHQNLACSHCGSRKSVPFTAVQRASINSSSAKADAIAVQLDKETLNEAISMHAAGKLETLCYIGAWLHESCADNYDEDN
jgi:transcription elongation factor Elf1